MSTNFVFTLVEPGPRGAVRYVGYSRTTLNRRITRFRTAIRQGVDSPVVNWLRQTGLDNVVVRIVEEVPEDRDLLEAAEYWVKVFSQGGHPLLNITERSYKNKMALTEEERARISRAHVGKVFSEETRRKLSEKAKGHKRRQGMTHTESAKEKMSVAHHVRDHVNKNTIKPECRWCNGEKPRYS